MTARIEYRCWRCRRDVPAELVARFPRTHGSATREGALCVACTEERAARSAAPPAAAHLTADDARAIRLAGEPARVLAERYALTVGQVRRIRSGELDRWS